MSIEKAKAYLRQFGAEDRVIEFPVSSATVELAAEAAHCEPARIAKTLSFQDRQPEVQGAVRLQGADARV